MATELALAYVSIVPETSKIAPEVASALRDSERLSKKSGQKIGSNLATGIGGKLKGALKKTAMGAGVAAGGAIAAGLTKGIGRLSAIEQAQSKLKGLGNSAKDVQSIMDDALASVKGTAFGLEEAATVAASAVAAGVKPGEELERTLKLVADASTIAGRDMSSMGLIFNKVLARGKLQGEELMQLSEAGIPMLALLGEQLGKTSEEVSKMVSDGKVGVKEFMAAIEDGMGGAALRSGETTVGAFKNMGAAAGRLGATLSKGLFGQARDAFVGITGVIDKMDAAVTPTMDRLNDSLSNKLVPAFKAATPELKRVAQDVAAAFKGSVTAADLQTIGNATTQMFKHMGSAAGQLLPPLASLASTAVKVASAISVGTWAAFADILSATAVIAEKVAVPIASVVGKIAGARPELISTVTAFMLLNKQVTKFSDSSRLKLGGVAKALSNLPGETGKLIQPLGGVVGKFGKLAGVLSGPVGVALTGVTVAIGGLVAASKKANAALDASEESAQKAEASFGRLKNSLILSRGEMDDAAVNEMTAALREMNTSTEKLAETSKLGVFMTAESMQAYRDTTGPVNDARAALDGLEEVQKQLGMTSEDTFKAIATGSKDYDKLIAAAENLGSNSEETVAHLERMRAKVESLRNMVAAADATDRFSAAMEVLGDAATSAEEKLQAFQYALAELSGRNLDAERANAAMNEQMRRNEEAFEAAASEAAALGQALADSENKINTTSDAGQNLFNSAEQMSAALYKQIQAMVENDAKQSEMVTTAERVHNSFMQNAIAAGMAKDEAKKLADAYIGVPEDVVTMIKTPNIAQAYAQLAKYQDKIDQVEGSKTVILETNDKEAIAAFEKVGLEVKKIKGGKIELSADDAKLRKALADANEGIFKYKELASQKKPKIDVDTSEANSKVDKLKSKIDSLPDTKTVNIITQETKVKKRTSSGGFAKGGFIPRNASAERDGILGVAEDGTPIAWVDAGEHVTRREMTQKYSRELAEINAGIFPKLPGYARGGTVGEGYRMSSKIKDKLYPLDLTGFALGRQDIRSIAGDKYVYGGRGWGDNLAAPVALARRAAGLSPFGEVPAVENLASYLTTLGARPGSWRKGMLGINFVHGGKDGSLVEAVLPDGQIVYMLPGKGGVVGGAHLPGMTQSFVMPATNPLAVLAGVQNLPDQLLDEDGQLLEGADLRRAIEQNGGASGLGALLEASGTKTAGASLGSVIGTAVKGQITDFLSVFGIDARTPPLVKALLQLAGMAGSEYGVSGGAGSAAQASSFEGKNYKPSRDEIARSMVATTPRYQAGKGVEQWRTTALAALEWLGMSTNMVEKVLGEIKLRSRGDTNFSAAAPSDYSDVDSSDKADESYQKRLAAYEADMAEWQARGGKDANGNPMARPKKPTPSGAKEFKDATVHGLMSLTPQEFFSNADSELPRQIYHPLANLVAGLKLMDSEYASLEMLWGEMQHFATGGKVKPNPKLKKYLQKMGIDVSKDDQMIAAKSGEMVMNEAAVAGHEALLTSLNRGVSLDERALRGMPANMALDVYDAVAPNLAYNVGSSATHLAGKTAATAVKLGGKGLSTVIGKGGQALGGVVAMVPGVGPLANAVIGTGSGLAADAVEIGSDVIGSGIEALTPVAAELVGMGAEQVALAGSRMMHAGVDTLNTGIPTLGELMADHSPTAAAALSGLSGLPSIGGAPQLAFSQQAGAGGDTFIFNSYNVADTYAKFNGLVTARNAGMGTIL